MKVEAIKAGYYGRYRKPGDIFEIKSASDLGRWMKPLEPEPKRPRPVSK